jgi:hypothetical protein
MPEIEIRFASDREYERLRHIRDKYGVQWRGMLIQGAKRLEGLRHPGLSRAARERPVSAECTEEPTEHDPASADAHTGRRQSFESR